jgi:spectinomycin phosphotransferase
VLCHGDPHLGNLLHEGADVVSLVDWDDVVLAPRERDIMFLRGGVLAALPVTAEREALTRPDGALSPAGSRTPR